MSPVLISFEVAVSSPKTSLHSLHPTGSVVFVGSLPGLLVAGWVLGRLGRRRSMALGAVPGLLGWVLVALGANVSMLAVGRCESQRDHCLSGANDHTVYRLMTYK